MQLFLFFGTLLSLSLVPYVNNSISQTCSLFRCTLLTVDYSQKDYCVLLLNKLNLDNAAIKFKQFEKVQIISKNGTISEYNNTNNINNNKCVKKVSCVYVEDVSLKSLLNNCCITRKCMGNNKPKDKCCVNDCVKDNLLTAVVLYMLCNNNQCVGQMIKNWIEKKGLNCNGMVCNVPFGNVTVTPNA